MLTWFAQVSRTRISQRYHINISIFHATIKKIRLDATFYLDITNDITHSSYQMRSCSSC